VNQSHFLDSLFLNLEGEIPVKGVRSVTPGIGGIKFLFQYPPNSDVTLFFFRLFFSFA
jgi:hypothetical protein